MQCYDNQKSILIKQGIVFIRSGRKIKRAEKDFSLALLCAGFVTAAAAGFYASSMEESRMETVMEDN